MFGDFYSENRAPDERQFVLADARLLLRTATDYIEQEFQTEARFVPLEWKHNIAREAFQALEPSLACSDTMCFEFYAPGVEEAGLEIGRLVANRRGLQRYSKKLVEVAHRLTCRETVGRAEKVLMRIVGAELPHTAEMLMRLSWYERQAFLFGFAQAFSSHRIGQRVD